MIINIPFNVNEPSETPDGGPWAAFGAAERLCGRNA